MEAWGTKHKAKAPDAEEKRKQYMKDYMPGYRAEHREELRRNYRKCVPPLSELVEGYVPLTAAKPIPPPPCGGDCDCGCPYDDGCRYPTWDEDHAPKPRNREREYAAKKRKLAEGGPWAEDQRARTRAYAAKHRAKVRFVKAGGSPARFEALWAKAGGDPEVFKTMTEQQEEGRT